MRRGMALIMFLPHRRRFCTPSTRCWCRLATCPFLSRPRLRPRPSRRRSRRPRPPPRRRLARSSHLLPLLPLPRHPLPRHLPLPRPLPHLPHRPRLLRPIRLPRTRPLPLASPLPLPLPPLLLRQTPPAPAPLPPLTPASSPSTTSSASVWRTCRVSRHLWTPRISSCSSATPPSPGPASSPMTTCVGRGVGRQGPPCRQEKRGCHQGGWEGVLAAGASASRMEFRCRAWGGIVGSGQGMSRGGARA